MELTKDNIQEAINKSKELLKSQGTYEMVQAPVNLWQLLKEEKKQKVIESINKTLGLLFNIGYFNAKV